MGINYLLLKSSILLLFVIIIVLLFINKDALSQKLFGVPLTPQPERFTELYFENHINLPSQVEAGQQYTFAFTVHNLEYKTMAYPYEVSLDTNGDKKVIDKKSFTLKENGTKTIAEHFTPITDATRSAVTVTLLNKNNQSIDFWIHE